MDVCLSYLSLLASTPLKVIFTGFDVAFGVEVHPVNAHHSMVAVFVAERVTMVDDVVLLTHAQHGMMSGSSGHARILLQNLADTAEGGLSGCR